MIFACYIANFTVFALLLHYLLVIHLFNAKGNSCLDEYFWRYRHTFWTVFEVFLPVLWFRLHREGAISVEFKFSSYFRNRDKWFYQLNAVVWLNMCTRRYTDPVYLQFIWDAIEVPLPDRNCNFDFILQFVRNERDPKCDTKKLSEQLGNALRDKCITLSGSRYKKADWSCISPFSGHDS